MQLIFQYMYICIPLIVWAEWTAEMSHFILLSSRMFTCQNTHILHNVQDNSSTAKMTFEPLNAEDDPSSSSSKGSW